MAADTPAVGGTLSVGLIGSAKKFRTFFASFIKACEDDASLQLRCVPIEDFDRPETWGVDVVFHKLSDEIAAAQLHTHPVNGCAASQPVAGSNGTPKDNAMRDMLATGPFYSDDEVASARKWLAAVEAWRAATRGVVFEPIPSVRLTTRRTLTASEVARAITAHPAMAAGVLVVLPWHCLVETSDEERALLEGVAAPCLVKSDVACGKSDTHHMRLVTPAAARLGSPVQPDDFHPTGAPPFPRIVQRFVSDAAVVVKSYVVGDVMTVRLIQNGIPRFNAAAAADDTWFSSQHGGHFPVVMESTQLPPPLVAAVGDGSDVTPDARAALAAFALQLHPALQDGDTLLSVIAAGVRIRRAFGLQLFGFDVAVGASVTEHPEKGDIGGRCVHVIDVNYFPGYKGVPDINAVVARLLRANVSIAPR